MPAYGSTDQVRRFAVRQYIDPARRRGEPIVRIHSGEFNKTLVESSTLSPNRLPIVCRALQSKKFLQENHLKLEEVQGPPSGLSSTVTFVYRFEKTAPPSVSKKTDSAFYALRGIMKNGYKKLGGAEAFHKKERESWNSD